MNTIESKIEYWHTHDTGNELFEFLGMTKAEYADFLSTGRIPERMEHQQWTDKH